jgi:hypothetical protein
MVAGLAVVLGSGAGLAVVPGSKATAAEDSAVTVVWAGGNGPELQQYQPARDPASVHYEDFADVRVTVARTRDLGDEVVGVTVAGMPGATRQLAQHSGAIAEFGANFVQAMQCWGDPADPEFYKNCQWGAWGIGTAIAATPSLALGGVLRAGHQGEDVPFRAVSGHEYSSVVTTDLGVSTAEWLQVFNRQTTNERTELVDSTGKSEFLFEVQSNDTQPYLGCGDESSATGTRCWLVVVPRGMHVTESNAGCPIVTDFEIHPENEPMLQQQSPVNPHCDYWANRIVVPLDFQPTGPACPSGSVERLVAGSEAVQSGFSSWQAGMCQSSGIAYSLTTAADRAVRGQLLTGQAGMAITSRPLVGDYLPEGYDPDQLAASEIVYAPVAVSGVVIAFLANAEGNREAELRLSPRLLAKMVTHSYKRDQALSNYNAVMDEASESWGTIPLALTNDPEFQALNPGTFAPVAGVLIMTGPNSADGIAQFWAYLQADDAARAFLGGYPDNILPGDEGNSGMTLNPYYLPKGHGGAQVPELYEGEARNPSTGTMTPTMLPARDEAGAIKMRSVGLAHDDGSPMCLCDTALDTFPKADETLNPPQLTSANQYRYDILQSRPYAEDATAAAQMVFRADNGSKTSWDTTAFTGLTPGAYVSNGMSRQTNVLLTGYTDAANAAAYGLATASLQAPNAPGVFVNADHAALTSALWAQTPTEVADVTVTDPASLPNDAYPLTSILYAAVNLGATDAAAREQYADLIEFAISDGQVPGHSIGQLPDGYAPLTDGLRAQALRAVQAIHDYDPGEEGPAPVPTPTASPSTGSASGTRPVGSAANAPGNTGGPSAFGDGAVPPADPVDDEALTPDEPATGYTQTQAIEAAATAGGQPPARAALGAALVVGLVGIVAGPLLLRRRKVRP